MYIHIYTYIHIYIYIYTYTHPSTHTHIYIYISTNINIQSNPNPGYITGGSRRGGAWRSGWVVWGRTGRRRVGSPRRQPFLLLPGHRRQLSNDLSAGRRPLFVPGCGPVHRRLFVSVNLFHAEHVRESKNLLPSSYLDAEGRRTPHLRFSEPKIGFPDMPCMKRVYRDK